MTAFFVITDRNPPLGGQVICATKYFAFVGVEYIRPFIIRAEYIQPLRDMFGIISTRVANMRPLQKQLLEITGYDFIANSVTLARKV